MNTLQDLDALLVITQAKYDQQQHSFQKLVAQENRLRSELMKLDASARASNTDPAGKQEMRAIGADIIWQGWVERTKTQLNLKLAQVLAQKLHHLELVKRAYGKLMVVKELRGQAQAKVKDKNARTTLVQAIDHSLFT